MVKINPKKFAAALYAVAREQGNIDKVFEDIFRLQKDLEQILELFKFLSDSKINFKIKQDALNKIYKDEIHSSVYNK